MQKIQGKLLIIPLLFLKYSRGEVNSVLIPGTGVCSETQFFDSAGLQCKECDPDNELHTRPDFGTTDPRGYNALRCKCKQAYSAVQNSCSQDDLRQGTCESVGCTTCEELDHVVATEDSQTCIPCSSVAPGDGIDAAPSLYDAASKDCMCNNPEKKAATGTPVLTRRLIEIYDSASPRLPLRKDCFVCPHGSAVLETALYEDGELSFVTVGKQYVATPYECAKCPDPNMFFDTDYSCVCDADRGYIMVGESSIGIQSCIKDIPSISTDYTRASFYSVESSSGQSSKKKFQVDSITFSHFYLRSSSQCEYLSGVHPGFAACQTLGNLCVMQLYDEDASACRQYQAVANARQRNYHAQEDWKFSMPWLYYQDEADDISTDRGIDMSMAFTERQGKSHSMKLRLAKYTLDGTYMGLEYLSGQFMYCREEEFPLGQGSDASAWSFFGRSRRVESSCPIETLFETEMFFYDAYVVDEGSESCSGKEESGECLYPIPVLHRNYVKDGSFPNRNQAKENEFDDRLFRRFFLFDNQSGRSASGLEVIRYAKTIVLKTTIQSEDPSKIYPPQLIIEYSERRTADVVVGPGATDTLVYKIDFTMNTSKFWTAVKVMVGFVSAMAGVVWLLRIYNWQNRNQKKGGDGSSGDLGVWYMIHVAMLACHTFVWAFAPFIYAICAYWFIFFKLQDVVFVMMPSDDEFYGLGNEYTFFYSFFHALFWSHTMYIGYIIQRQSQAEVFFVDWEKPKSRNWNVSAWRTILVANRWKEMQTMRKTSIEFTLLSVGYLLVGLKLYNLAATQPGIHDLSDGHINIALHFANVVNLWLLVSLVQWAWRFLIYERYFLEPHGQYFIDLCTMAKVSPFIMDEPYHGYYLHCRSPHEFADCSMCDMLEQLKREEGGFTTDRGLDAPGAPRDCQSFELFASHPFRRRLSKISSPFRHRGSADFESREGANVGHSGGRFGSRKGIGGPEKSDHVYVEYNNFLQSFIEQSPPPSKNGLRHVVRFPSQAEKLLGMTPPDIVTKESNCIFYPDEPSWAQDYGFVGVTFLGIEPDLLLHDILMFNIVHVAFGDPAISILLTYVKHLFFVFVRGRLGRANIASTTHIDKRFII